MSYTKPFCLPCSASASMAAPLVCCSAMVMAWASETVAAAMAAFSSLCDLAARAPKLAVDRMAVAKTMVVNLLIYSLLKSRGMCVK